MGQVHPMLSLQNLLHRPDKLLCLLEASALQARGSVQALLVLTGKTGPHLAAEDVAYSRFRDRKITEEITEEVYSTYVASLDREDIERLSSVLYKVAKLADKFGERWQACPDLVGSFDFTEQLSFLDKAVNILVQLIGSLRHGLDPARVKELTGQLESVEEEADKRMAAFYKELYSGKYPAVQVLVIKDLLELLRKLMDRNRDASDIIAHVAVKNA